MKHLFVCLLLAASAVHAQNTEKTIRICDSSGCSERPRNSTTFDPNAGADPEGGRRIAALTSVAEQNPRAAFDLGLRYFRGDGVTQNTYHALQWMRSAGERGNLQAQGALGRFYLAGLEEMGPDPAEAERWLTMAVSGGDKEANKLLAQATAAKNDERELYRWREDQRKNWIVGWYTVYSYYGRWSPGGWYFR